MKKKYCVFHLKNYSVLVVFLLISAVHSAASESESLSLIVEYIFHKSYKNIISSSELLICLNLVTSSDVPIL